MSNSPETKIQQFSKFTTLRVLRTRRNRIRRLAEKKGMRIETLADQVILLGLEKLESPSIQENN